MFENVIASTAVLTLMPKFLVCSLSPEYRSAPLPAIVACFDIPVDKIATLWFNFENQLKVRLEKARVTI